MKYIHGNAGRGTFTWYGGHDPEDYQHAVGDPPTDISLHKNSPGYRLILNNILFPAAKRRNKNLIKFYPSHIHYIAYIIIHYSTENL